MNNEFFQRMHERDQRETPVNQALKAKLARELQLGRSLSWFKRFFGWMGSHARPVGGFALAGALILVFSFGMHRGGSFPAVFQVGPVTDDWQYGGEMVESEKMVASSLGVQRATSFSSAGAPAALTAPSMPMAAYESVADASLGFSVGGAKDVGNFRENIKQGFLPAESDITYEGLFYDYSFDTGQRQACDELFCPSYARALVRNPVTNQEETYLSVGLNSNINESDFKRQKTNFVVVLDISGSMSSPFDQYYYDGHGNRIEVPAAEASKTKMQLANESLSALVDQLNPDDRLGIVLFSDAATVAKPLRLVGETDRTALKSHIMKLQPTNGTNMSAGLEAGMKLLACNDSIVVAAQCVNDGYAKRIIFITDAMPNQGEFGAGGLHGLVERYTTEGIQTTLLGVGVDFQTELVEALTKVRGANYLSIHSAQEFKKRLGEEFDFLVSPLVYDLKLDVKSSGYAIEEIYGSPDADLSSGEVLHVRTLFPSKTEHGETKGGVILLKLRKTGEGGAITLKASYEDKMGKKFNTESTASFVGLSVGTPDNQGIRKGVLLAQYAKLLKDWIREERGQNNAFITSGNAGWDRVSRPLQVSENALSRFTQFLTYFKQEAKVIGDASMEKEKSVLEKVINVGIERREPRLPIQPTPLDDWKY